MNSTHERVRQYHSFGWKCIPLVEYRPPAEVKAAVTAQIGPKTSKMPVHKHWQESGGFRLEAFGPKNGIGVLLPDSGLVHVDVDDLGEAIVGFKRANLDLLVLCAGAPHLQGRPGRGGWLFRAPPGFNLRSRAWNKDQHTVLELRSSGYTCVPGTIHPDTGKEYRWGEVQPSASIPFLPPELLRVWDKFDHYEPVLSGRVHDSAREAQQARPEANLLTTNPLRHMFNARTPCAELLIEAGYTQQADRWLPPNSTTGVAGVVILPPSEQIPYEVVFSHNASSVLAGEHGHTAFSALNLLFHGGDWQRAEADAAFRMAPTGQVIAWTHKGPIHEAETTQQAATSPRFERYTAGELLAHDAYSKPLRFHVENFFPNSEGKGGTIVAVTGAPGIGKSWVGLHMAICLALGRNVFGMPNLVVPEPCASAFVTLEMPMHMMRARLTSLLDTLQLTPEERACVLQSVILLAPMTPPLDANNDQVSYSENFLPLVSDAFGVTRQVLPNVQALTDELTSMKRDAKGLPLRVAIFDSQTNLHASNENDATAMLRFVTTVRQLLGLSGLDGIVIAHVAKSEGKTTQRDTYGSIRGSSALVAAYQAILSIGPADPKLLERIDPATHRRYATAHFPAKQVRYEGNPTFGLYFDGGINPRALKTGEIPTPTMRERFDSIGFDVEAAYAICQLVLRWFNRKERTPSERETGVDLNQVHKSNNAKIRGISSADLPTLCERMADAGLIQLGPDWTTGTSLRTRSIRTMFIDQQDLDDAFMQYRDQTGDAINPPGDDFNELL